MKCDLHVHSWHSGMCTIPVLKRICRECYTPADELYSRLKRRGMNLVTVTDHDSIDAAEGLRRHPDFFLSEEVTVTLPSGCEAHVGVYDISERQHGELQARRHDVPSLLGYLDEQNLLYSINHVFSALTGKRVAEDLQLFAEKFPAFETRNGAMPARSNEAAKELCERLARIAIGGSDSHGVLSLGRVWTSVPGAKNKDEFFAGLRRRKSEVHGAHGSYMRLSAELLTIAGNLFHEKPWTLSLTPLIALIPLAALVNYGFEIQFEAYWRRRWLNKLSPANVIDVEQAEELAA